MKSPRDPRPGVRRGALVRGLLAARLLARYRPLLVNIEPTHRCNLACSFCDKARGDGPQMAIGDAAALLDSLARAGTASVCFDGGEPLTHPGIGALVRRARGHGMRVAISTNGTLIARRLRDLEGVNVLKVSLDGSEEVHDAGRGPGAYRRAVAGARAARAAGLPVALRMTLCRHNSHDWEHVLATAEAMGAQALFQPGIGSLLDARKVEGPQSAEIASYRAVIAAIATAKRRGRPVANEYVCLPHLARWPAPVPVPFCAGGRIQAAVGPDLRMYPCGRRGRGAPAPDVLALGAAEAFAALERPADCAHCWCTLTLACCYLYRLDPRLLRGRRWRPGPRRSLP